MIPNGPIYSHFSLVYIFLHCIRTSMLWLLKRVPDFGFPWSPAHPDNRRQSIALPGTTSCFLLLCLDRTMTWDKKNALRCLSPDQISCLIFEHKPVYHSMEMKFTLWYVKYLVQENRMRADSSAANSEGIWCFTAVKRYSLMVIQQNRIYFQIRVPMAITYMIGGMYLHTRYIQ